MARILVVDDAKFMRFALTDMLTKMGHQVVGEAEDGKEAIEQYKRLLPDIVTMDITMPVMEGVEAVKHIRAFDQNASIIMCSAMGQQAMVVEAIRAGAKDFVVKPIQTERLKTAIEKILDSSS